MAYMQNSNNFQCNVGGCRFPHTHVTLGHLCGTCKTYGHGRIECNNNNKIKELNDKYKNDTIPQELWCSIVPCEYKKLHTLTSHHCSVCLANHSSSLHNHANISNTDNIPSVADQSFKINCPICRTDNIINKEQKPVPGMTDTCSVCLSDPVQIYFPSCGHVCICKPCFERMTEIKDNGFCNIITHQNLPSEIKERALRKFGSLPGNILCETYGGMGCSWFIRRSQNNGQLHGFFMHADSWGQYGEASDETPQLNIFLAGYTKV